MFDFASRIAKLDAVSLDREFITFLKREVTGLLTAFTNEDNLQKFAPEINLLIKFVIWKFTTSSSGSTIGQKLLGIKYVLDPGKLKLLFILEGFIPYVIERLNTLRDTPTLERIRTPLKYAENIRKFLSLINFCLFLIQNRYPTLATRLLSLPIVAINRQLGPSAGYTYQIRELLWHQFADFLITILPLINFQKLKRSVAQLVRGSQPQPPVTPAATNSNEDNLSDEHSVNLMGSVLSCSICKEDAVIPHKVGNEYFCYFCYQGIFDDGF